MLQLSHAHVTVLNFLADDTIDGIEGFHTTFKLRGKSSVEQHVLFGETRAGDDEGGLLDGQTIESESTWTKLHIESLDSKIKFCLQKSYGGKILIFEYKNVSQTGFVGAEHVHGSKFFDGSQARDKGLMRGHVARTDSQSGGGDDLNGDRNGGDEDNDANGDDVAGGAFFDSHLCDNACDEDQGGEGKSDGDEEDHALEMLT